ncbi:MAG TPA: DUF4340 domain-containing protein [Anaerolineae bacterium]|nr:DUF4340 domain-containing protein [Anaerolineae bacterium]
MNRINRILFGLLAAQIVLAVLVFLPRFVPTSAESAPLFGSLTPADVTAIRILDETGNRVDLVKRGDVWTVAETDDFPADPSRIDSFLTKVAGLKTNLLVTRTSASHKRLKVADDDFARRVDLTQADGSTATLFIGSASGGGTHVRAGGQDEAYLTPDLSSFDANTNVNGWIDTTYLSVPQDKVTSLKLENANGTLEFEKDASGNWTLKDLAAGEVFNPNNLTTLLTRLSSLAMIRPLGKADKPEYGLDKPAAVVTVTADDDSGGTKTTVLRVGAKDDESDSYVVISSESPYYVRMAGFSLEDFVTRTRQDFLQAQPTPEATVAPEITATPEVPPTLEIAPTVEATPTARPTP